MTKQENRGSSEWDLVISPKASFFDLKLKDVWNYRYLLWLFVKRDFTAQYKQTILGPLWHLLQPVFTTIVFMLVFGKIARIPTEGLNPILFYMSGISIWNYFSACLTSTSNTFVSNASIFGKVYFPRLVIPLSSVLSNMVRFGIQFLLLLGVIIWFGIKDGGIYFSATWLLIPLLVFMMAAFGLGLGIVISSLTTKYRDLTVLLGFAVQLFMYITPIAYPLSYIREKSFARWIEWNPLSPIVEAFRYSLFGTGSLDHSGLLYSGICIVVILFFGMLVFNKVERSFMDTV